MNWWSLIIVVAILAHVSAGPTMSNSIDDLLEEDKESKGVKREKEIKENKEEYVKEVTKQVKEKEVKEVNKLKENKDIYVKEVIGKFEYAKTPQPTKTEPKKQKGILDPINKVAEGISQVACVLMSSFCDAFQCLIDSIKLRSNFD